MENIRLVIFINLPIKRCCLFPQKCCRFIIHMFMMVIHIVMMVRAHNFVEQKLSPIVDITPLYLILYDTSDDLRNMN